jgi:hypothetical protein
MRAHTTEPRQLNHAIRIAESRLNVAASPCNLREGMQRFTFVFAIALLMQEDGRAGEKLLEPHRICLTTENFCTEGEWPRMPLYYFRWHCLY